VKPKDVEVNEVSDEDNTFETFDGSKMKNHNKQSSKMDNSFMNSSFDYNPFTPREEDDEFDLDLFHFWPNFGHKATFMAIHNGL